MSLLQEEFRSASTVLYLQDRRDASAEYGVGLGYDERWLDAYRAEFARYNPWLQPKRMGAIPRTMTDTWLDVGKPAAERFDRSYYYNEWARPQGFRHALGTLLDLQGDRVLVFNYWRGPEAGPFQPDEVQRHAVLMTHMRRAIDLGRRFEQVRRDGETARHAAENANAGIIILDRLGRVREVNAQAQRLFQADEAITIRDSRLVATVPSEDAALQDFLGRMSAEDGPPGAEMGPLLLRRAPDRPALAIKCIALARHTVPLPSDTQAATIVLVRAMVPSGPAFEARLQRVARDIGLTRSEARTVALLIGAGNLRQAAAAHDIRYETARSQLKAAFAKAGVRSQRELIQLIGSGWI